MRNNRAQALHYMPAILPRMDHIPIIMRWFLIKLALNIEDVVETDKGAHTNGTQALLGTTCLRFCHEWTNYHWFNTCITRKGLWVVHIVTACAIAPMALMIDTGQDEGSGSKFRVGDPPWQFMASET